MVGYSKTANIALAGAQSDAQKANYRYDPPHHNTCHYLKRLLINTNNFPTSTKDTPDQVYTWHGTGLSATELLY